VAGNDPIARNELAGHAEIEAAVRDELVDLFEGAGIEQEVDALARRQLAGFALATKTFFSAAELRAPVQIGEDVVHPMRH
jgi:hypothetical protein